MVLLQTIYSAILISGSTWLLVDAVNFTDSPRYIEYVDSETNTTRVIDTRARSDASALHRLGLRDINTYLLYTRKNPAKPQMLFHKVPRSIEQSHFTPTDQTIVIVHGWKEDWRSKINKAIRDAFLNTMYANIIVVDWSKVASCNYITATLGVPQVGKNLGQLLQQLNLGVGASFNTMHLIGFSLGAHIVGNAGNYLAGRVARITGLDPAGPMWNINPNRLSMAHAMYVEAIHTDRLVLGTKGRSGHVDFYPNRGANQPGCLIITSCSHHRSWQLFAATVIYEHLHGRQCQSEAEFDFDMCFGQRLHVGSDALFKNGSGKYTLKTDGEYPYNQIG